MIVVAGHLTVSADERAAYLDSVSDVTRQARASRGCLAFVQVPDPIEADRIVIYERWESDADLRAFRESGPSDAPVPDPPLPEVLGADVSEYRISTGAGVEHRPVMEPRISLVTLGVADLQRARAFYAALGWHGQEVEETVFVQAGAQALVLWDREKLAADCGLPPAPATSGAIVLAHNVRSTAEVDAIVATAQAAGATVPRPPTQTFYGGYAGVFCDPDGHAWEIAHNPAFELDTAGGLTLPDFGAA